MNVIIKMRSILILTLVIIGAIIGFEWGAQAKNTLLVSTIISSKQTNASSLQTGDEGAAGC